MFFFIAENFLMANILKKCFIAIAVIWLTSSLPVLSIENEKIVNEKVVNQLSDNSNLPHNLEKKEEIFADSVHITASEFRYADNPLYTISGELPYSQSNIKPIPAIALGAIYSTAFIAQHCVQMNTIWKNRTNFRFMEDGEYALWVDKPGHFYGCYTTSYFARESFIWAGFKHETAIWMGAALGLAYSTYVEILDGFGENWGFSPSDFYADLGGAAFSVAQHYVPFLQNFTPKFQYVPSNWIGEKKRIPAEIMIDDYSSQVFWLSVNVNNLLPEKLEKYWPDWMQISLGYTARNLCDPYDSRCQGGHWDVMKDNVYGDPKFIIAMDYDLVKLLPDGGSFWMWLKQSLNLLKFPSPALEISKSNTKFRLVYPFSLKIGNFKF